MKYKIVCDKHEFDFEDKVNTLLEEGWTLYGDTNVNLVCVDKELMCWYSQSFVKNS